MSLPTLSGTGRLTADPDLRFSPSGTPVVKINLAFNARRLNKQTNEWEDGDTFFVNATAFNSLAENVAETMAKGMEVVVTGRLKTEQWEDREGNKRSTPSLLIDSIGPNLAYATAKVQKASRSSNGGGNNGNGGQASRSGGRNDAWGSGNGSAGFDDEPPF